MSNNGNERFTPGTWKVIDNCYVKDYLDYTVCVCKKSNEGNANAALIAAAPEMYWLINELIQHSIRIDDSVVDMDLVLNAWEDLVDRARPILKIARGE